MQQVPVAKSHFTPLPPSPLRSAGPGLQESLHHYALRMASSCCLSLRALERMLLRHEAREKTYGNAIFPSSWIGPRSNFRELLFALKRDTGVQDLHYGTFHIVADVIGRGGTRRRQVRGEGRAWCPSCYLNWDDKTSCEPLLWAFDMLTACPMHKVLLETRCPSCNAPQSFSAPYRSRRLCQYCHASLGHSRQIFENDRQNDWVNKTLLLFSQWIGETSEPIVIGNYHRFLSDLLDGQVEGKRLPDIIRQYCAANRDAARRNRSLPTISGLLNLAAYQGTTIQEILCEPTFAASTKPT